jgi:hypothetical protein
MEPSQNKQKPILIAVLISLFLVSTISAGYLIYKYKSELNNQSKIGKINTTKMNPLPYINTFELPNAKVGTGYYGEVFATLMGANEDLPITITDLPDGLTLGKCSQEFDSKLIPTPNTLTKCLIEGIPAKDGLYQTKVSATNKNNSGYHTVEQTIDLVVTTP